MSRTGKPSKRIMDKKLQRGAKQGAIYRCTMDRVYKILKKTNVTENHVLACKNTPFYDLFRGLYELDPKVILKKSDEMTKEIIRCYKPKEEGFKLGKKKLNKIVYLTEEDIKLIFAINCKKETVPRTSESQLRTKYFPNVNVISCKAVVDAVEISIKDGDMEDFARLLTLLAFGSIFFSTKGDYIPNRYVGAVDNLAKICDYNWAREIHENLMNSIRDNHKPDPSKVSGCILALLVWYYEHTTKETPARPNAYPRCLKWQLNKRPFSFKRNVIRKLEKHQIIDKLQDKTKGLTSRRETKEDDYHGINSVTSSSASTDDEKSKAKAVKLNNDEDESSVEGDFSDKETSDADNDDDDAYSHDGYAGQKSFNKLKAQNEKLEVELRTVRSENDHLRKSETELEKELRELKAENEKLKEIILHLSGTQGASQKDEQDRENDDGHKEEADKEEGEEKEQQIEEDFVDKQEGENKEEREVHDSEGREMEEKTKVNSTAICLYECDIETPQPMITVIELEDTSEDSNSLQQTPSKKERKGRLKKADPCCKENHQEAVKKGKSRGLEKNFDKEFKKQKKVDNLEKDGGKVGKKKGNNVGLTVCKKKARDDNVKGKRKSDELQKDGVTVGKKKAKKDDKKKATDAIVIKNGKSYEVEKEDEEDVKQKRMMDDLIKVVDKEIARRGSTIN